MSKNNEKGTSSRGHAGGGPPHMMHGEKPKEFKKTLRRLAGYLKPRKNQLIFVSIAAIFSTLFNVISPKLLGDATTSIFASITKGTGIDFTFLSQLLLILIGLYVLSALFAYLQQYIMAGVSQMTTAELRQAVNEKLTKLPLRYYDQHPHGDVLSRVINDIDNINNSIQQALSQLITSAIAIIGTIIMMLVISPLLTLVALITLPLSAVVIRFIASFSQKHFVNQQKELGNVNGHVEEMFSGHQVVKAFGQEKTSIEKFDEMNDRLYESGWKAQFISGIMMPLMTFVGNIGYVFVSIAGGILVLNRTIFLGDVQAFIQYTQQLSQPMAQAAGIANMIQTALASAERIFALLDEEEERVEERLPVNLDSLDGSISFEHVRFGYDPEKPVIKDLSLEVKSGQTIAIVGPTGAGKTTIINLLMKFYEVNKGKITIDKISLHELSREQVRSMFAMVLQDTWLFNGSIRDNIAYGRSGATEKEIIRAAESAYADDFIRTLPEGYDTILTEDASNISQGQRQLITIARAILANPKILILDEATSSVDTRTEMNIQLAMNKLMAGRTSFVIAHRLSTIRDADIILVMNEGDIIEKGSHDELMNQNGFYADLYRSQFSEKSAG
ncbi:ABC transporter ATP-binding protein [Bacillus sp. FJAT-49711]|uniref:ABC transporter ATP-binding protein n=1 Tax=Bacillus sp. FJAT-49711 TaxID=2833585 RepID=UPI001BCA5DFE|nr:ABC transporter ATP-binding protein [Bacillus sp. FJAT-49711]MBS4220804.1 ABC transporter ATP-binding protein [Bacillus sp. FJAT-49711]